MIHLYISSKPSFKCLFLYKSNIEELWSKYFTKCLLYALRYNKRYVYMLFILKTALEDSILILDRHKNWSLGRLSNLPEFRHPGHVQSSLFKVSLSLEPERWLLHPLSTLVYFYCTCFVVNIVRLCPARVRYLFFKSQVKELIMKQCLHKTRLQGSILIGREGTGICSEDVFS